MSACLHPDERWTYVEHRGQTWNQCLDCGLLELWAGGQLISTEEAAPPLKPASQQVKHMEGRGKSVAHQNT